MKVERSIFTAVLLLLMLNLNAQKGEVWPVYSQQQYDVDEQVQITKEYEAKTTCSFFIFINNNEFIHVTDSITSLYKIVKRQKGKAGNDIYTVVSEAGNIYTMAFNKEAKDIVLLSKQKGFGWYYKCLSPYVTPVVENFNK